jgi:tetratricopeptide (TPR) repeat protein
MLDGFCAVEAKDWPRAVTMLARAAVLAPNEALPHLELSLALTTLKRHDEALRHVDRALTLASEGCAAAAAWRRRGFILFEMGALADARGAYEKSLQLEPGNPLALSELSLIADELRRGGGSQVAAGKTGGTGATGGTAVTQGGSQGASATGPQGKFAPPPSNVVLTECRDGRSRPAGSTKAP